MTKTHHTTLNIPADLRFEMLEYLLKEGRRMGMGKCRSATEFILEAIGEKLEREGGNK